MELQSLKYSNLERLDNFGYRWKNADDRAYLLGALLLWALGISGLVFLLSMTVINGKSGWFFVFLTVAIVLSGFFAWNIWGWIHSSLSLDGLAKRKGSASMRGREAEMRFGQILAELLPDDCYLLEGVHFPYRKSATGFRETDLIVVSPKGIWIIEVKNYKERLLISRLKDWQVGFPEEPRRNAFKQLWSQEKAVKSWLENQNLGDMPVHGIVALSHPEVRPMLEEQAAIPYPIVRSALEIVMAIDKDPSPDDFDSLDIGFHVQRLKQGEPVCMPAI